MSEELVIADICRTMGWDWWTFNAQPNWFLEHVRLLRECEHDAATRPTRKS